jgi:uncharacterized protein YlbG (UPF0298 family)
MTAITVRLSDKDKAALEKYGKISDVVRDEIRMYINNNQARDALKRLKNYQKKNPISTTTEEIVALIREDRDSH